MPGTKDMNMPKNVNIPKLRHYSNAEIILESAHS